MCRITQDVEYCINCGRTILYRDNFDPCVRVQQFSRSCRTPAQWCRGTLYRHIEETYVQSCHRCHPHSHPYADDYEYEDELDEEEDIPLTPPHRRSLRFPAEVSPPRQTLARHVNRLPSPPPAYHNTTTSQRISQPPPQYSPPRRNLTQPQLYVREPSPEPARVRFQSSPARRTQTLPQDLSAHEVEENFRGPSHHHPESQNNRLDILQIIGQRDRPRSAHGIRARLHRAWHGPEFRYD